MRKKPLKIAVLAFFLSIITLFSAFFALPLPSFAEEGKENEPEVENCKAFVLYNITQQKYVIEKDGFALLPTSTSAKIIMGLIACEALEGRLEETVTVTREMLAESSGYSMKLKDGEQIRIQDLLYGAICGSYNDAAYALAHIISGSSAKFVERMNARALELGAKNTHYENPLGYPDHESMITTAYDTLKIALAASENQLYMTVSSALKHSVPKTNLTAEREFYNRNHLISTASTTAYHNEKCSGMNAGISSDAAGWSIVTHVRDDGADYICVLLGGIEDASRNLAYDEVNKQINYICNKYNSFTVYKKGTPLGTASVAHTSMPTNDAPCVAKEDIVVYVPTDEGAQLTTDIRINEDIKAPISAGTVVGKIVISMNGRKVGEGEIVLAESYEANGVMKAIGSLGEYTKSRAFVLTLVFFAVLTSVALLLRYTNPNFFTKPKYRKYK